MTNDNDTRPIKTVTITTDVREVAALGMLLNLIIDNRAVIDIASIPLLDEEITESLRHWNGIVDKALESGKTA